MIIVSYYHIQNEWVIRISKIWHRLGVSSILSLTMSLSLCSSLSLSLYLCLFVIFLNSYCHELSEYVWFYQLVTPLSSDNAHTHIHTHTISTLDYSGKKCKLVQQGIPNARYCRGMICHCQKKMIKHISWQVWPRLLQSSRARETNKAAANWKSVTFLTRSNNVRLFTIWGPVAV